MDFFMLLQKLKTTKRTGWVRKGVPGPESIADHMYRMGMMALVAGSIPGSGVDQARAIKMAIVHDVAESIVGDITPHCKVSNEEKAELEASAIRQIQGMLGKDTAAAAEIAELWYEYEAGATPEAALIKDIDKLEMIVQAAEYEGVSAAGGGGPASLQEFFDSTAGKWRTEIGKAWAEELVARRAAKQSAGAAQGSGSA